MCSIFCGWVTLFNRESPLGETCVFIPLTTVVLKLDHIYPKKNGMYERSYTFPRRKFVYEKLTAIFYVNFLVFHKLAN